MPMLLTRPSQLLLINGKHREEIHIVLLLQGTQQDYVSESHALARDGALSKRMWAEGWRYLQPWQGRKSPVNYPSPPSFPTPK